MKTQLLRTVGRPIAFAILASLSLPLFADDDGGNESNDSPHSSSSLVWKTFGRPKYNPDAGVYEQRVKVTNRTSTVVVGVRLTVSELPADVTLLNSIDPPQPIFEDWLPLGVGESHDVLAVYAAPSREHGKFKPEYSLEALASTQIAPASVTVPAAGVTYPVSVSSTGRWYVRESLAWASVSTTQGQGNGTVNVTLLPNTAPVSRTGVITIGNQQHFIRQQGVAAGPAPVISPLSPSYSAMVGTPFGIAISVQNGPATLSAVGLPPGLTLNPGTFVISGSPPAAGTFNVTLTATNAVGSTTATFTLVVAALPPGLVGTYQGLIERSATAHIGALGDLGARLDLTVAATGATTGRITEGSTVFAFTGSLTGNPGSPSEPTLTATVSGGTLALSFNAATSRITGTLTNTATGDSANASGWRNVWSITNPPSNFQALHNVGMENTAATGPQGFGYASLNVAISGITTLSGKLADGTAAAGSSAAGPLGEVLVYQAGTLGRGSFMGYMAITPGSTAPSNNTVAGNLTWLKLPATTTTDTLYPEGFGPLPIVAEGGTFAAPAVGTNVLGQPIVTGSGSNAKLAVTLGGLEIESPSQEFEQLLRLDTGVTMGLPNPNTTTLAVTNPNGILNGTFAISTPGLTRNVTYSGAVIPTSGGIKGLGHFVIPQIPVPPQTLATAPKLSGRIEFLPLAVGP